MEPAAESDSRPDRRSAFLAGFGHAFRRLAPIGVWLAAVAAAWYMHDRAFGPVKAIGVVESRVASLAALDSRYVEQLFVRLHDPVANGQMLLALDDRPEREQLSQLASDIAELQARLSISRSQLDVDRRRRDLSAADLNRSLAIDRADAHIGVLEQMTVNAADRALLTGAQFDLERLSRLPPEYPPALQELNAAQTRVNELQARLQSNEDVLARRQTEWTDADRRWHQAVEPLVGVPSADEESLILLQHAVDGKHAELRAATRGLERLILRAPVDGQVTGLFAGAGENVQGGQVLVRITAPSSHQVIAYVRQDKADIPRIGGRVRVERIAARASARGVIVSIADEITELPARYQLARASPHWGRAVQIRCDTPLAALSGEALHVYFD